MIKLSSFLRALKGREAQLGKDQKDTLRSAINLSSCFHRAGKIEYFERFETDVSYNRNELEFNSFRKLVRPTKYIKQTLNLKNPIPFKPLNSTKLSLPPHLKRLHNPTRNRRILHPRPRQINHNKLLPLPPPPPSTHSPNSSILPSSSLKY